MSKLTQKTLSLKQFMLRQEVLKLYRDIFRTIKLVPDANSQHELRTWARHDFRANKQQNDEVAIKMLINYGRRSLTELKTSLSLSGAAPDEKIK
ncbi:LYR motif-containing protein 2 [Stomoxys calcitrans]|uniref:LYR motif-containing protein 2 n=1 Tax=Stomoxys calcitrans TaxID=35570 RepID=A0A1I8P5G9_STOCA|nr:LYR motif-containing protein 2 [Stomoxys calcitrans]